MRNFVLIVSSFIFVFNFYAQEESQTQFCDDVSYILLALDAKKSDTLKGNLREDKKFDEEFKEWHSIIDFFDLKKTYVGNIYGLDYLDSYVDENDFNDNIDTIFTMIYNELKVCLSDYCKFGEDFNVKEDTDYITHKRIWVQKNEYFNTGMMLYLNTYRFGDKKGKKYVKLHFY